MTEPIFSDQEIEEFRQSWFEEFGEQIDVDTARLRADRFLRTIALIVKLSDRASQRNDTNAATDVQTDAINSRTA